MKKLKIILLIEGIAIVALVLLIIIFSAKPADKIADPIPQEQENKVYHYSIAIGDFLNSGMINVVDNGDNLFNSAENRFLYTILMLQNDQNTDDYLSYKVQKDVLNDTYNELFNINDDITVTSKYEDMNTCPESPDYFCWNVIDEGSDDKYEMFDGTIDGNTYSGDYVIYDSEDNIVGNGEYIVNFDYVDNRLVISSFSIPQ